MTIRSFVAINIDPEQKNRIVRLISPLKKDLKDFRFTESHNLHLTLRFFGDITSEESAKSQDVLQEIAHRFSPFNLEFDGLMAFPSFSQAKVLGVKAKNSKLLAQLFTRIKSDFNLLNIGEEEKRNFIPHLTVARAINRAGDISFLNDFKLNGRQRISSIELMKSELHPAGPVYEIIQSFPLCQK